MGRFQIRYSASQVDKLYFLNICIHFLDPRDASFEWQPVYTFHFTRLCENRSTQRAEKRKTKTNVSRYTIRLRIVIAPPVNDMLYGSIHTIHFEMHRSRTTLALTCLRLEDDTRMIQLRENQWNTRALRVYIVDDHSCGLAPFIRYKLPI